MEMGHENNTYGNPLEKMELSLYMCTSEMLRHLRCPLAPHCNKFLDNPESAEPLVKDM